MTRYLLIPCLLLTALPMFAGPLTLRESHVTFVAVGTPGFLKINGKGGTLQGQLLHSGRDLTGEFRVVMDQFSTGIDLRDEHMKKNYFEVAKYPEALLKITKLSWNGGSQKEVPFKGSLKFHGVENPIEGTVDIKVDKSRYDLDAKFSMALSDYKIDIPTYAGVKVADKVEVKADIQAEEKP